MSLMVWFFIFLAVFRCTKSEDIFEDFSDPSGSYEWTSEPSSTVQKWIWNDFQNSSNVPIGPNGVRPNSSNGLNPFFMEVFVKPSGIAHLHSRDHLFHEGSRISFEYWIAISPPFRPYINVSLVKEEGEHVLFWNIRPEESTNAWNSSQVLEFDGTGYTKVCLKGYRTNGDTTGVAVTNILLNTGTDPTTTSGTTETTNVTTVTTTTTPSDTTYTTTATTARTTTTTGNTTSTTDASTATRTTSTGDTTDTMIATTGTTTTTTGGTTDNTYTTRATTTATPSYTPDTTGANTYTTTNITGNTTDSADATTATTTSTRSDTIDTADATTATTTATTSRTTNATVTTTTDATSDTTATMDTLRPCPSICTLTTTLLPPTTESPPDAQVILIPLIGGLTGFFAITLCVCHVVVAETSNRKKKSHNNPNNTIPV